jgi:hypothetical protein
MAIAVKGFHSHASLPYDHSYLSIYLEQREALLKSTCPHSSFKKTTMLNERLPNILNLLHRGSVESRSGWGKAASTQNIFSKCVCLWGVL